MGLFDKTLEAENSGRRTNESSGRTPARTGGRPARTPLVYIDKDGLISSRFPTGQVALNFMDHDWPPYLAALKGLAVATIRLMAE